MAKRGPKVKHVVKVGQRFGRAKVVQILPGRYENSNDRRVRLRCDCGRLWEKRTYCIRKDEQCRRCAHEARSDHYDRWTRGER